MHLLQNQQSCKSDLLYCVECKLVQLVEDCSNLFIHLGELLSSLELSSLCSLSEYLERLLVFFYKEQFLCNLVQVEKKYQAFRKPELVVEQFSQHVAK